MLLLRIECTYAFQGDIGKEILDLPRNTRAARAPGTVRLREPSAVGVSGLPSIYVPISCALSRCRSRG